jgi:hypothetical protein
MPASCITQSQSKPLVSLPSQRQAPSTSMLTAPNDVPSAPGASRTFDADSSGAGVPCLTDATKGKYGGVTRHAAG